MKITFEGATIAEILKQMDDMVDGINASKPPVPMPAKEFAKISQLREPPVDVFGENPVDEPVEKPRRERTEKQKANDEKLRIAALAKKKKPEPVQAAPVIKKAAPKPPPPPVEEPEDEDEDEQQVDPADLVKLRMKTIEDLQAAYAGGFQKEVFELLSRFGDGAKSFREVPVEAFPAIRDAIDKGALT